jgi:hypothetical protein
MISSPYSNIDSSKWLEKTENLVNEHPLTSNTILTTTLKTWKELWQSKIGDGETAIPLSEINPPATVIGYVFERLFARHLERQFPDIWRGSRSKSEKDLVYIPDRNFSVEVKTSGQLGTKIFGNRSYNQQSADDTQTSKIEKSGYYILINFFKQDITLIRFGWIDAGDWKAQKSSTGQAATLKEEVYKYKLITIPGDYRLNAPIGLLDGIGKKRVSLFETEGIKTVKDLLMYEGKNKHYLALKAKLKTEYQSEE